MSLVPIGAPREVAGVSVQYLGDRSHTHEGSHQLTVSGRKVVVGPGGPGTARKRSHVITAVLHGTEHCGEHRLEALIGALILAGVHNITIDGAPLPGSAGEHRLASLRLDIDHDGSNPVISVTSIGGVR